MLEAVHVVAEMAAIGFKLPVNTFTDYMLQGPHLLAPTGNPALLPLSLLGADAKTHCPPALLPCAPKMPCVTRNLL